VAPGAGRISILMPPGQYTVKLTVDGREQSQPLTVLKDPHSAGTAADIAEQMTMLRGLKADLERGAAAVQRIEALRVQLGTLFRFSDDTQVKSSVQTLADKLTALQMNLVDLRLTGRGQDGVRFEARLLQKIAYLAGGLAGGDFKPTNQQNEVRALLATQLNEQLQAFDTLMRGDVAALNTLLRNKGMTIIAGEIRR
jgi:hypothetical protein